MTYFLLGLLGFIILHSLRVLAPSWREARIAAWGEPVWKGVYSLLSIALFVLLVWGFGQARQDPTLLWAPSPVLRNAGMMITLVVFVLLVAAYMPRNHIRRGIGHPMTAAIALWAIAHLLMTGWLHGVLLSVGLLVWAVLVWINARQRPKTAAASPASVLASIVTVVLGTAVWAAFAFDLHRRFIGVAPY
jgi:uncharacterized membrane protein